MIDKIPDWIKYVVKLGAASLIAIYLVYSNNELMKSTIIGMNNTVNTQNKTLIDHEATTKELRDAIKLLIMNQNQQIKVLNVICGNTATDSFRRVRCEDAKE